MMGRRRWSFLLLLQVLGQTLLVVSQVDSSPANKTIRIGYLRQFPEVAGAINVAIDRAQNDGLLRDYNFRYKILLFRLCSYSCKIKKILSCMICLIFIAHLYSRPSFGKSYLNFVIAFRSETRKSCCSKETARCRFVLF